MRIQSQLINIKLESTIENCRTFGRKKQEEVLADQRANEWKLYVAGITTTKQRKQKHRISTHVLPFETKC